MAGILLWGPILYSTFGYWMYSVPSLLTNEVVEIDHITSALHTNHRIYSAFTTITPATPYLLMFVIAVICKLDHHFKFAKYYIFKSTKLQKIVDLMK